jgi:HSP20 family protein
MAEKKELAIRNPALDPFGLWRQMTAELDRVFDEPFWPSFPRPAFRPFTKDAAAWLPKVDVFEKDNRMVTRVDLPGMKKEDVTVEVTDGHLVISGERKLEKEETKEKMYRKEREYGSFYRVLPLPEGVKLEDIAATFADGVLEVGVPLPAKVEPAMRKVEVKEPGKAVKPAA